jgi:hypothetical protein
MPARRWRGLSSTLVVIVAAVTAAACSSPSGDPTSTSSVPPSGDLSTASAVTTAPTSAQSAAATQIIKVAAVDGDGNPAPGYTVTDELGTGVDCSYALPAASALNDNIRWCAPTASSTNVCWSQPGSAVILCGMDPRKKELRRITLSSPVGPVTAPTDALPWGLETSPTDLTALSETAAHGTDDRMASPTPTFATAKPHSCSPTALTPLLTPPSPIWTVQVGQLQGLDVPVPPPSAVAVTTAYFAADS